MNNKREVNFTFNSNDLGYSDLGSLSKVMDWLSNHNLKYNIESIGYNINSGNVYAFISDSNTNVMSSFNQEVTFLGYTNDEEVYLSEEEFLKANQ